MEKWEWSFFFLMGRIVLKFYYSFLIIMLSNAREFFNRKTIKMCEKGRLLYKPQSLSYPFISQVLKVITTNPNIKISKWRSQWLLSWPQFSVAFLTKQIQPLLYPNNSVEFGKTHPLAFGHLIGLQFIKHYNYAQMLASDLHLHMNSTCGESSWDNQYNNGWHNLWMLANNHLDTFLER